MEIDHTVLDYQVVHPISGIVLGRPTLTWAMDHNTRVILGYRLSLAPASTVAVLLCMQQMMEDKTASVIGLPNLAEASWHHHGVPRTVVLDNGAEFHGDSFLSACERHKIDVQYCPPGTPWFKGRCERFVRTLNTGLIHLLPGTTRSNPKDRGDYPASELASLTLAELDQLIKRWIIAIDYKDADLLTKLHDTMRSGANVIVDVAAKANLATNLAVAAPGGRIVIVGGTGDTNFNALHVIAKGLTIAGVDLNAVPAARMAQIHAYIGSGLAVGALRPASGRVMPLSQAVEAHQLIESGNAGGGVVLVP